MALWTSTDNANGKPKNLTTAEKTTVFGVNETEAAVAANKAKGITTPGWTQYTTYTDSSGNTRHKAICLVALGGATVATMGDAADDATVADA